MRKFKRKKALARYGNSKLMFQLLKTRKKDFQKLDASLFNTQVEKAKGENLIGTYIFEVLVRDWSDMHLMAGKNNSVFDQ